MQHPGPGPASHHAGAVAEPQASERAAVPVRRNPGHAARPGRGLRRQNSMHQLAGCPARRTNRCRDGDTPRRACPRTLDPGVTHITPGPGGMPRRATRRRGRCSVRQSKQENFATDAHRCTLMGRGPACSFTARTARPGLMSSAGAVCTVPSVCICVHLWRNFLACFAEPTATMPVAKSSGKTPCTNSRRRRRSASAIGSSRAKHARPLCTNSARHNDGGNQPDHRTIRDRIGGRQPSGRRRAEDRQEPMHQDGVARRAAICPDAIRGDATPCQAVLPRRCFAATGARRDACGKKPMHQFGTAR